MFTSHYLKGHLSSHVNMGLYDAYVQNIIQNHDQMNSRQFTQK